MGAIATGTCSYFTRTSSYRELFKANMDRWNKGDRSLHGRRMTLMLAKTLTEKNQYRYFQYGLTRQHLSSWLPRVVTKFFNGKWGGFLELDPIFIW